MVNFLRHEINVFVLAVLSFHAIFEREKFIFISIFYDKTNLEFVHGGIYLFFHFTIISLDQPSSQLPAAIHFKTLSLPPLLMLVLFGLYSICLGCALVGGVLSDSMRHEILTS